MLALGRICGILHGQADIWYNINSPMHHDRIKHAGRRFEPGRRISPTVASQKPGQARIQTCSRTEHLLSRRFGRLPKSTHKVAWMSWISASSTCLKMFDALNFLAWLPAERMSNLVDLPRSRRISMNQSSEAMPQRGGAGLANWHGCLMLPHAASTTPLDSLGLLRTP